MTYLLVLIALICCMLLVDHRWRLFLFHRPVRALLVLAAGVGYFLWWDVWAIAEGIFLHRESDLMTGVMLADQLPLEEAFFLLFLSLNTMVLFTAAVRVAESWGRRGRPGFASGHARSAPDGRSARDGEQT
ncbi:lycopene cyclase domain-containing protein [Micrococcus luteus]